MSALVLKQSIGIRRQVQAYSSVLTTISDWKNTELKMIDNKHILELRSDFTELADCLTKHVLNAMRATTTEDDMRTWRDS